jgi:hypothetical protein
MSRRLIALTVLVVVMIAMVPGPSPAVVTVPQAAPVTGPMPKPTEVLLDVAAHNAALIASIRGDVLPLTHAFAALNKIAVNPVVRAKMALALAHGAWIITTTTPVTSHGWTGTPWVAIQGPAQGLYLNAAPYTNFSAGEHFDATTHDEDSLPGMALAKDITAFGKALTELGVALTATGKGLPGPAGKAATALGLALTALGLAVASVGLEQQAAILGAAKSGHVDPDPTVPDAGGPAGSAPNGPGATDTGPGANPPGATPDVGQSIGISGPGSDGPSSGGGTPGDSGSTGDGGGDL